MNILEVDLRQEYGEYVPCLNCKGLVKVPHKYPMSDRWRHKTGSRFCYPFKNGGDEREAYPDFPVKEDS